jgi:uncharacterized membrane protein
MTIDRSRCAATRHGTRAAYDNDNCRCPDAREDYRVYRKRLREGRHNNGRTNPVGTARRLQALAAIGWDATTLATRLGRSRDVIRQWRRTRGSWIAGADAADVTRLYNQLEGTPGPNPRMRAYAASYGWAPPLLWDELDIDDPAANPHDDAAAPARRGRIDTDDVTHLARFGLPLDVIAARLGVQPSSIERHLERGRARTRTCDKGAAA